jgi:hypothetical protein
MVSVRQRFAVRKERPRSQSVIAAIDRRDLTCHKNIQMRDHFSISRRRDFV